MREQLIYNEKQLNKSNLALTFLIPPLSQLGGFAHQNNSCCWKIQHPISTSSTSSIEIFFPSSRVIVAIYSDNIESAEQWVIFDLYLMTCCEFTTINFNNMLTLFAFLQSFTQSYNPCFFLISIKYNFNKKSTWWNFYSCSIEKICSPSFI